MSYLVMECNKSYAVVMDNCGRFIKTANFNYTVGQEVESIVAYDIGRYKKTSVSSYTKRFISVAACICFIFIGSWQLVFSTYGTIRVQINPDVEISINRLLYVTKIKGLNDDGKEIVEGIKVFGKRPDQITNEVTQRAISDGKLDNDGQILLSVNTKNRKSTEEVEEKIVLNLTVYLENENEKTNTSRIDVKKQEDNQTLINLTARPQVAKEKPIDNLSGEVTEKHKENGNVKDTETDDISVAGNNRDITQTVTDGSNNTVKEALDGKIGPTETKPNYQTQTKEPENIVEGNEKTVKTPLEEKSKEEDDVEKKDNKTENRDEKLRIAKIEAERTEEEAERAEKAYEVAKENLENAIEEGRSSQEIEKAREVYEKAKDIYNQAEEAHERAEEAYERAEEDALGLQEPKDDEEKDDKQNEDEKDLADHEKEEWEKDLEEAKKALYMAIESGKSKEEIQEAMDALKEAEEKAEEAEEKAEKSHKGSDYEEGRGYKGGDGDKEGNDHLPDEDSDKEDEKKSESHKPHEDEPENKSEKSDEEKQRGYDEEDGSKGDRNSDSPDEDEDTED